MGEAKNNHTRQRSLSVRSPLTTPHAGFPPEDASLLPAFYLDNDPSFPQKTIFTNSNNAVHTSGNITTTSAFKFLLAQLISTVQSIVIAFIPSFTPKYGSSARDTESARRLSPTAYLDGLRGVAAFIVYITHFVVNWFPSMRNTYGASEDDHYFVQLPIIRVLFHGVTAVTIFFIISGYALSYNTLKKIAGGNKAEVLDALSSSIFRRCFRLYMPVMVNTFICMLLSHNGYFQGDAEGWNTTPPKLDTFKLQFWDWWAHQQVIMYPLLSYEETLQTYSPPYNGHLWTIPLEIRGSFVVYCTVLAVAKLNPFWRMTVLGLWTSYLWYEGRWDLFLFVTGTLLANIDVSRRMAASKESSDHDDEEKEGLLLPIEEPHPTRENVCCSTISRFFPRYEKLDSLFDLLRDLFPYALFIFAMYLMSFPHFEMGAWILPYLTPDFWDRMPDWLGKKAHAWRCMGSVLMMIALSLSPPLSPPPSSTASSPSSPTLMRFPTRTRLANLTIVRRVLQTTAYRIHNTIQSFNLQSLFACSFSQYLGRISFGLYLMHGPVLFTMGTKMFLNPAYNSFWGEGELKGDWHHYWVMFGKAAVCNTVLTVWAADVFTRVVDERAVRWAGRGARFMSRQTTGEGRGEKKGAGERRAGKLS